MAELAQLITVATQDAPRVVDVKGAGRHYLCPDGALRASVTTILEAIGKAGLIQWAANQERTLVAAAAADLYEALQLPGAGTMTRPAFLASLDERAGKERAHVREKNKAAEIGTQVHKFIEWTLRKELGQVVGPQPAISPKAMVAVQRFEAWRQTVALVPLRIEQTIWSRAYDYAGTLDLLATMQVHGVPCPAVLDWKSGKRVYPEARLQNAAYVQALVEMGHIQGAPHGVIVRLPKLDHDPDVELVMIAPSEQAQLFEIFLAVKRLWTWLQGHERARQDARTRPAPPLTAAEPPASTEREAVVAEITAAKAALAKQPSDAQWSRIVQHSCGGGAELAMVQDLAALRNLLHVVQRLGQNDTVMIAIIRKVLATPEPDVPSEGKTAEVPVEHAGGSLVKPDTAAASLGTVAPRDPVHEPAEAAMLVEAGDPRETLLTEIAEAKGKLERQPPAAIWDQILLATSGTVDLLTATTAQLEPLRALVMGLAAKDPAVIARVSAILAKK